MGFFHASVLLLVALTATQAAAWGNHSLAAYRAFEKMPELANAPSVPVEPLESFLRTEENTIEALLASQEAWAKANLEKYPARPAGLAFVADPARSDEARRNAFLRALRLAPNSKLALYFQVDPWNPLAGTSLAASAVSTLPENLGTGGKFLALKAGDTLSALSVLASATDEPDYGMDHLLWEDSPSEWGRGYGFGNQPYGNGPGASSSHTPFHTSYQHENRLLYLAAPQFKRSYLPLRVHQFSTLASLAFRTGHAYWGWRFAGLTVHYLQDVTQPFQASLAPGQLTAKVLASHVLAMTGWSGLKDDLAILLGNRLWALNQYQSEMLERSAANKQEGALDRALRAMDKDKSYPEWSDRYLRDVVAAQASNAAPGLVQTLVATLPEAYVNDPGFDAASQAVGIPLLGEMARRDASERLRLETSVAELMGNLGAHSRNALRGILRASSPP